MASPAGIAHRCHNAPPLSSSFHGIVVRRFRSQNTCSFPAVFLLHPRNVPSFPKFPGSTPDRPKGLRRAYFPRKQCETSLITVSTVFHTDRTVHRTPLQLLSPPKTKSPSGLDAIRSPLPHTRLLSSIDIEHFPSSPHHPALYHPFIAAGWLSAHEPAFAMHTPPSLSRSLSSLDTR